MKVCNNCGIEIDGLDGDNFCDNCEDKDEDDLDEITKDERDEREEVYRDLGLVKVRGALGGSYWE